MNYFNLNNTSEKVDLKTAILKSLGSQEGLYMPESLPQLSKKYFENIHQLTLQEIGYEVAKSMFQNDIDDRAIRDIVEEALNFEIPLRRLSKNLHVLELFHGPTLAFKDVGARFMAGLFAHFIAQEKKETTILVATSGDTGGAVASAFYKQVGITVVILYPKGKVSLLQEKQLTTLGENIIALEIDGNFDDCQAIVKRAFLDEDINKVRNLTSANSINFARLFPQSIYYHFAFAQLRANHKPVLISVPSGNFGNLTAGLIAKKMGLPIAHFIASTNENHIVPTYLETGMFEPQPTIYTISNAMDVSKPSNFPRMMHLYNQSAEALRKDISGWWCNDAINKKGILELLHKYQYQADPHGAIAYLAIEAFAEKENYDCIFIETAHPAKFPESIEELTNEKVAIPTALAGLFEKPKKSITMSNKFESLKDYLLG